MRGDARPCSNIRGPARSRRREHYLLEVDFEGLEVLDVGRVGGSPPVSALEGLRHGDEGGCVWGGVNRRREACKSNQFYADMQWGFRLCFKLLG